MSHEAAFWNDSTFWGHLFLFLTLLVNLGYSWVREGRAHRWQQEQREAMATLRLDVKNGHGTG